MNSYQSNKMARTLRIKKFFFFSFVRQFSFLEIKDFSCETGSWELIRIQNIHFTPHLSQIDWKAQEVFFIISHKFQWKFSFSFI